MIKCSKYVHTHSNDMSLLGLAAIRAYLEESEVFQRMCNVWKNSCLRYSGRKKPKKCSILRFYVEFLKRFDIDFWRDFVFFEGILCWFHIKNFYGEILCERSFYKLLRNCPTRCQQVSKKKGKNPAKFQAAVSICQFLCPWMLLYPVAYLSKTTNLRLTHTTSVELNNCATGQCENRAIFKI